ncbi:hypothetical protein NQ317_013828 [Molorchus minor]|uniref:Uncharacterized protein n=1 Tax=Molorchus minor TaxID=1323400 RepID=A0ABQ9JTG1_9CUCU|nr:hypothetical protein NQ317_013828 [Molorchus minor]
MGRLVVTRPAVSMCSRIVIDLKIPTSQLWLALLNLKYNIAMRGERLELLVNKAESLNNGVSLLQDTLFKI